MTAWATRTSGRGTGTTLPGRVALLIAPGLLGRLTRQRTVVLVSGTNGKTTTTRFIASAARSAGDVVTNDAGANLLSGVASCLVLTRTAPGAPAVLEVDEIALLGVTRALRASVIVLLNLSRDQLDRGGEVAHHVERWTSALRWAPEAVVVANADEPLVCAAVLAARPDGARTRWVAAGSGWTRESPLCPVCSGPWGEQHLLWACRACGFTRPRPGWSVDGDRIDAPDGRGHEARLALPGRVNVGNAAMAAAAALELGVGPPDALAAMRTVTDVDGRYLRASLEGVSLRLLLAKNPAGWSEVLQDLLTDGAPVVLSVNARTADGIDTSWLWDVDFDRLRGREVVVVGERATDLSVRLTYAQVPHRRGTDGLAEAVGLGAPHVDVVGNYSAFVQLRAALTSGAVADPALPGGRR